MISQSQSWLIMR